MEQLIRPLTILLGAALGSAMRHAFDIRGGDFSNRMTPLMRLAMTAAGSFLAGFFAARLALLGMSAPGSERPLISRVIGVFLVGLVAGFVAFPAFWQNSSAPDPDAEAGKVVFHVASSLVVSVTFFLVGALCARMAAT